MKFEDPHPSLALSPSVTLPPGVSSVKDTVLIILISAIRICNKYRRRSRNQNVTYQDSEDDDGMVHERVHDPDFNDNVMYIPIRNTVDTY
jgi:hypothetical protein